MKTILNLALASATAFIVTGCGDTNSDASPQVQQAGIQSISSLQREVSYLTDSVNEMSLYTFDKDMLNSTDCNAACQETWPIFTGGNTASTDIAVFDTNTSHLAYGQHPIYFFVNDTVTGDVKGDNVKDVWHLIYAPSGTNDTQTKFSTADQNMTQTFLTGKNNMSLYTFDKDDVNNSVCYGTSDAMPLGSCEARWPVFYTADLGTLPAGTIASDFGTIDRNLTKALKDSDGEIIATKQTTYKGQPLYYWFKDTKAGETTGDWIGGVWHLIELKAQKTSTLTPSIYTAQAAALGQAIFEDSNKCASCHGANGADTVGGGNNINLLNDSIYRDAALVDARLKDMKGANTLNRVSAMTNVAQNLSDEAIVNLSAYIATLKL